MGLTAYATRDGEGQLLRITEATYLDEGNATTNYNLSEELRASNQSSSDDIIIMRIDIPTRAELGLPAKAIFKDISVFFEKITAGTVQLDIYRMKNEYANFLAATSTFSINGFQAWTPSPDAADTIFDVPAGRYNILSGDNSYFSLIDIFNVGRNVDWFGQSVSLAIYGTTATGSYYTIYSDYHESQLDEPLDASETEIDVDDGSKYATDDVILIDDEEMTVSSISSNELTVVREDNDTTAAIHSDNTVIYNLTRVPQYKIKYELPSPEAYVISTSGDGENATVDIDKQALDGDQQKINIAWHTTSGSLAFNTNATDFEDFGRGSYSSTEFSGSPMATENDTYYFGLFSEDSLNVDVDATISNKAPATRPLITSVVASATPWANTGDSGTLTITANTGGDWTANGAGSLKYLYINWDGPATGATITDAGVSKIEITASNATAVSRSHIYSTAGTKYVWVAIEDTLGFRSGMHRIDDDDDNIGGVDGNIATPAALPAPAARNPIPVALASKKTHLHCKYGIIDSANTLNAIKSTPGVSDAEIYHYLWQHDDTSSAGTLLTAFSTDNDNQYFEEESKKVAVKCNWGSDSSANRPMDGTTLTVYGLASFFDDSGTETGIEDLSGSFTAENGYYRYAKSTISPASTENDYGGLSSNYFKTIDKIVVTVKDSQDIAANQVRYQIATSVTAGAGAVEMVNNRICCTAADPLWGNYATVTTTGAGVTHLGSDYIEDTDVNPEFIEKGFAIGDKVYVEGDHASGIADGVYTISALTDERMTFTEDLGGSGEQVESHQVHIDTRANASIPYSSYNATVGGPESVITLATSQSRLALSPQTTTLNIRHRLPRELDLDSLIDSGHIALVDATVSRAGGVVGKMPVGDRQYPIGISRTSAGMPTITATIKVLNQTGLRTLWNLLEGNRYDWCLLESDRIDSPALPHRTFVLKMQDGSLKRDGASGKHYTASLKFIAIGEEV